MATDDRLAAARGRAGVSWEAVRTPLFAIRGASELLLSGELGPLREPARELVVAIAEAALRLERVLPPLLRAAAATRPRPGRLRALALEPALAGAGFAPCPASAELAVLAAPSAFAELLAVAGELLEEPRRARARGGRRGRVLLLDLAGARPRLRDPSARALLGPFLGRLAAQAGARLLSATAAELRLVVRSAPGSGAAGARGVADGAMEGAPRSQGA